MNDKRAIASQFVLKFLPKLYSQLGEDDPCNWSMVGPGKANNNINYISISGLGYPGEFRYIPSDQATSLFLRNSLDHFDPADYVINRREYEDLWKTKRGFHLTDEAITRTSLDGNSVLSIGIEEYDSEDTNDREAVMVLMPNEDSNFITSLSRRYFKAMCNRNHALPMNDYGEIDTGGNVMFEHIIVNPDRSITRGRDQYCNHIEFWYQVSKLIDAGARYLVTQYALPSDIYEKTERYIVWLLHRDYPLREEDFA